MNSTLKTIIIVLVVILLAGLLFRATGFRFGGSNRVVDDQYALGNGSTKTGDSKVNTKTTTGTKTTGTTGTTVNSETSIPSDASLMALMNVARIRVPQTGVDVTLNQGEADFTDGSIKGHVVLGRILGRVPTDSGYDVFVNLTVTKANNPSVMHYVALFRNVGQAIMYTSTVSIGDRLILTGVMAEPDKTTPYGKSQLYMVSATGYSLTVSYLDRKNAEPLTVTPTVPKTVTLHVKNHIVSK